MLLPLAHHNLVMALPAFGPVLLVSLVLAVHAFRNRVRGGTDEGELAEETCD